MADGITFWLTGLSGAGKTCIADALTTLLKARQLPLEVLDGDVVRTHLSRGLGFSKEDRDTNIRRIGWVAATLNRHGVHVIVAAISPYRAVRAEMRASLPRFIEIFCDAPLETLIARDTKGLYRRALAGELTQFTGINDPYEAPTAAEVHLRCDVGDPEIYARTVLRAAELLGFLTPSPLPGPIAEAAIRRDLGDLNR